MKTSVIGFPRVGKLRELKFVTEKFFRGEADVAELEKTGKEIRLEQWKWQKDSRIDFIPSGDFSFYDTILDAAVLFNIIPKRYKTLGLSEQDTYFAGNKLVDEYLEAKENGFETKPVIAGPFTLLKLIRFVGEKGTRDFAGQLCEAYCELVGKLEKAGAAWIQFDEPYLVHDLTKEDQELFVELYDKILSQKKGVKILLQTYFGDVRDVYETVAAMDFDGIGLDFIEGKETAALVGKYGFPEDKLLFAGVVNGKNIWRNHYQKTLDLLEGLQAKNISVVISTSCSLLHVPYTLQNEGKLQENVGKHLQREKKAIRCRKTQDCLHKQETVVIRRFRSVFLR